MSKILKVLAMSLLLASIMIATIGAGTVFADWDNGKAPDHAIQDRLQDGSCDGDCDGDGPSW